MKQFTVEVIYFILRIIFFPVILFWLAILALFRSIAWIIDDTYDHDAASKTDNGYSQWIEKFLHKK